MRLVSVTARNYRIHGEVTVAFDPSRTVVGGPNESGKSTLAEAVHRALFLRSRASGAVLESMRSRFHPGHPAVELTFESGGATYTVSKQFTGTNAAPTTLVEAGGPTLRNEAAEEALARIVAAEAVGGRNAEDRLRLQWAHLWVWQGSAGASPLDREAIGAPLDRLHERLGSLGGGDVLESRLDAMVGRLVTETLAARTKESGAPKASSPLGEAETELAAARARREAAQAAIDALEGAVAAAEQAAAAIAASETSLAARKGEQEENDARLEQARLHEIGRAERQAAVTAADARLAALLEDDRQIREAEARIAAIEERREPAAERLARSVTAERDAAERVAAALAEARRCRDAQADATALAALHARAEHLARRRLERAGLAGRCARIATLRLEAADLQARLDPLPVVTAADLADLAALERKRDACQATLDAIMTRIEVLEAADTVRLGGRDLPAESPTTITAEAELQVGRTRLRVSPGGGTSLADAARLRDAARATLEARLLAASVADVDEARRVQPLRQTVESALAAKQAAIADLGDTQADADLAALDGEITALEVEFTAALQPGFERPANLEAAVTARKALDEQVRSAAGETAAATAAHQAAESRLDEARRDRGGAEDTVRTLDDELRTAQARRAVLVEEHGADRTEALATAVAARDAAAAALADTEERLARLQPDLLRQAATRLQRAVEKLIEGKQAAHAARTIALERLRSEGTLDPREDLARAAAEERLAEARRQRALREARAYALLARLFAEKNREVETRFVEPLAARVTDYLRCLFGADVTLTVDHAEGRFRALAVARPDFGGAPIEFGHLSGGGREQVAAAFRLAMAEILAAEHEGCLPMVFDDAFVNSDPARAAGVLAMLDLAAARGLQIIVLSCQPRAYDALGAATVELAPAVLDRGNAATPRPESAAGVQA